MKRLKLSVALPLVAMLHLLIASDCSVSALQQVLLAQTNRDHGSDEAEVGHWIKLKTGAEFSPIQRYGHSAIIYEPTTKDKLTKL